MQGDMMIMTLTVGLYYRQWASSPSVTPVVEALQKLLGHAPLDLVSRTFGTTACDGLNAAFGAREHLLNSGKHTTESSKDDVQWSLWYKGGHHCNHRCHKKHGLHGLRTAPITN